MTSQVPSKPPSLRRSQSWPPYLFADSAEPISFHERHYPAPSPEKPENGSSSSITSVLDSISLQSSTDTSYSTEIGAEQKKAGFRATVSKRWIQTKQALQGRAKLYREQHRGRHRDRGNVTSPERVLPPRSDHTLGQTPWDKPLESSRHIVADASVQADREKSDKRPLDRKHHGKSESANRDTERSDLDSRKGSERKDTPGKELLRRESTKNKADKAKCKTEVTNPPHELSTSLDQFRFGDSGERGRGRTSEKFPAAFTCRGELLFDNIGRHARKSRTSSGRRHSWREPALGIVPVHEEANASKEYVLMEPRSDQSKTPDSRRSGGRKSTL